MHFITPPCLNYRSPNKALWSTSCRSTEWGVELKFSSKGEDTGLCGTFNPPRQWIVYWSNRGEITQGVKVSEVWMHMHASMLVQFLSVNHIGRAPSAKLCRRARQWKGAFDIIHPLRRVTLLKMTNLQRASKYPDYNHDSCNKQLLLDVTASPARRADDRTSL